MLKKLIVFAVIGLLGAGAVSVVINSAPQREIAKEDNDERIKRMPVSVRVIKPKSYPAKISTLGEVRPRYRSTIKAQVDGRISFLSDKLQVGTIVRAGDRLIGIEKSPYLVHVAESQNRLQSARLDVLKEEKEAHDAKKNWKRSGIRRPSSPLVFRTPHLEAARANLNAATSALENARFQLGHTEIKAPYDGVVLKRFVNPGETLFAGDEVATLYGLEAVEVGISLDVTQWASLSTPIENTAAWLIDPRQKAAWEAVVVRKSMHFDQETRLRVLYLEVMDPLSQKPPLLPGTFVRAELTGKELADLLCIPEAAQTKEGLVWLVDKENRLMAHHTEPLFYGEGVVYIQNPEPKEKTMRVAVSPNASFTNGLLVQPIEEGGNA